VESRHKHCEALCKRLQHNCSPSNKCNTGVILIVWIRHHIPGPKIWRLVWNVTSHPADGEHGVLREYIPDCVRDVRAVRNAQVFLMETRVVTHVSRDFFETNISRCPVTCTMFNASLTIIGLQLSYSTMKPCCEAYHTYPKNCTSHGCLQPLSLVGIHCTIHLDFKNIIAATHTHLT